MNMSQYLESRWVELIGVKIFQETYLNCVNGEEWTQEVGNADVKPECIPGCESNRECQRGDVCDLNTHKCNPVTCDSELPKSKNAVS